MSNKEAIFIDFLKYTIYYCFYVQNVADSHKMKYDDNLVIVRSVINNGIIFVSIFILSTCDDKRNTRVPTLKTYSMCIICTLHIIFSFIHF